MKEQKSEKERVVMSVTIRADQKQWLEEHPEINLSGLVRKSIDDMRKALERMQRKKQGGE